MKKTLILFSLIAIATVIIGTSWYRNAAHSTLTFPSNQAMDFEVISGDSLYLVLENIQSKGWIDSTLWFRVFVKLNPEYAYIQAGHHSFLPQTTYIQLLERLQFGKEKTTSVTFLEGWRTTEYIDALVAKGFDRKELETCLKTCEFSFEYEFFPKNLQEISYEGYFYPDTYQISQSTSAKEIFTLLLKTFEDKIASQVETISAQELYKIITVASMLEREVITLEDQRLVAGILENRVEAGMSLGIDASVLYALGDWKAELNYQTLDIKSPYNTRKFVGYPPGPISHPGLQSIQAALSPKPSNYYFYLTDIEGTVYYAENLAGHNINKVKYIP